MSRLWSKIAQGTADECWPWTAYCDADGYGRLRTGKTNRPAHVLVLEEVTGEPANGRFGLHSCDNPSCCNPAHLWWGTQQDNHDDKVVKQRQARGEAHGQAKLTQADVIAIRARHVRHGRVDGTLAIARDYKVNKNTIDRIVNHRGWSA